MKILVLDNIFKIVGFSVTFLTGSLPLVIPKWQTAREECKGKVTDLEYIIKHKCFHCSRKEGGWKYSIWRVYFSSDRKTAEVKIGKGFL